MTWQGEAAADAAAIETSAAQARQRWREGWRSLMGALTDGARLSLLGRPALKTPYAAGTFWAVTTLGVLASAGLAWLSVAEPRLFSISALQTEGFYVAVLLFEAYLVARWAGRADQLWPLATLLMATALVVSPILTLVQDHLLASLLEKNPLWFSLYMAAAVGWWIAIYRRALTSLSLGPNDRQRAAIALVLVIGANALYWQVGGDRFWHKDYAAAYEAERASQPPDLVAEEVFSGQPRLLDAALATLAPQTPGKPDLYFVSFGGYGAQDVFMKESLYGARLFETRFGAAGRTLALVNNPDRLADLPLASVTNLRQALNHIGRQIDRDEDLLFLFLTSHGSEDAELSVSLRGLDFMPLSAPVLKEVLDESGIRWRVVVISACYSGSFIDSIKDDHTLVISASRADRRSFGCSDEAEFTYFGRAYFQEALNRTRSFSEAFTIARGLVTDWEKAEGQTPSEPQHATTPAIEAKLVEWQQTLPP